MVDSNLVQEFILLRDRLRKENEKYTKSNKLTIGDFSYGIPRIRTWREPSKCIIGKFCSIADNVVVVLGGNHRTDWISTYPFNRLLKNFSYIQGHPYSKGDVVIENDVWIGSDVKIMSGVTISNGAVIAANAVVTNNVPPYTIVGGVPARSIKVRFSRETIEDLLNIKWWDWEYEYILQAIPFLQSDNIDEILKINKSIKRKSN